MKNFIKNNYVQISLFVGSITIVTLLAVVRGGFAFVGPSGTGGVGSGALSSDSGNNIAIGTSTPKSDTKLFLQSSSTSDSEYAIKVIQPSGGTVFALRNDGTIGLGTSIPAGGSTSSVIAGGNIITSGNVTAASFIGSLSGGVNASNVTAGVFGAGNFAFPSSLGVATGTQVSLPATLSVYGTGYFSGTLTVGGGTGKINAGTIDPPYTINGKPYATYLPSITGVKEETTGVVRCTIQANGYCKYVLDFKAAEDGSDLWLFSKVTNLKKNFGAMSVLLTPSFSGKSWYVKDVASMQVVLYALPDNGAVGGAQKDNGPEISYRLTAPRFDAGKWPNTTDGSSQGFIIND
ncbi:MAG: hypothetical protein V1489_02255 [Candidatus Liptonbacteria bacterium]